MSQENGAESAASISADANSFFDSAPVDVNQMESDTALDALKDVSDNEAEVELKTEQKEEEPKKEDPLSQKFAALSRKEKQLRLKEKELDTRFKDMETKLKSLETPKAPEAAKEEVALEIRMRKDPIGTLKSLGYDMNKLAELTLNDGKLPIETQMQLMREEMQAEYKKEIETLRNEKQQEQEQERAKKDTQLIEDYKNEITEFISSNNEKYEYIAATQNEELIYDTIIEYHKEHGTVLSNEEAADLVESYLEEEAKNVFEKTKKAKRILGVQEVKQETKPSSKPLSSPTLTNGAASQVPTSQKPLMSNDESLREAAKLIRWQE